jgi:signal transduction histidine kinase
MVHQLSRDCPLASALAGRLRSSRRELTQHWLGRIAERVQIDVNRVFPTEELLDHVPLLIEGIADYLEEPAAEVGVDAPVVGKAMELGALRHAQGFDAYEILKEYEILGGILYNYLAHVADELDEPCEKSELLACGQRLFRAIALIQEATTTHYLRLAATQIKEREERLRAFNRAVSHEIKNRIGAIIGAADMMHDYPNLKEEERKRFVEIVQRNAQAMQSAVTNVLSIGRSAGDVRQQRNVPLSSAVKEAMRQVREATQACGVNIEVGELPEMEVNAAAVELSLTNYLSNSLKYADPSTERPWVRIEATRERSPGIGSELVVRVRDNGLGVPTEMRDRLFERFFRAHETVTGVEGTGLGLSIVREAVETLGGRAWAEFPEHGAVFAFALPDRRTSGEQRAVGQSSALT